jgi:hypothetical protein
MPDWLPISADAVGWFAVVVVLSWVFTLLAVPVLVARIPVDYFSHPHRHPMYSDTRHPVVGWGLAALKNVLGVVLILLGILMLLTPGQGILTILIGVLLVNFPGKFAMERWVVTRPGVLRTLNGFRAKIGRPPIDPP